MKNNTIRLNEEQLRSIVAESVKRVLREMSWEDSPEFDNVENSDIPRYNGNYTEVIVPSHCLSYLVNGDMSGYEDNEIRAMQAFENKWQGKLANGLNIGDICVPLDGREPSFSPNNDVYGREGADCYKFLVPLK